MRLGSYLLVMLLVAAAFSAAAVLAERRRGRRGLWTAWGVSSLVLLAAGIWAWAQLPAKETPLISYLLLALLPTLASAGVVNWGGRHALPGVATWALATATFLVAFFPTMFVSYYFLARLLPRVLGCCPL